MHSGNGVQKLGTRPTLTYYAKSTDYQFATESRVVFPEVESQELVGLALICEVPVGVATAYLTYIKVEQQGEVYTGIARVDYTYEGDDTISHQIEYALDRAATKIQMH